MARLSSNTHFRRAYAPHNGVDVDVVHAVYRTLDGAAAQDPAHAGSAVYEARIMAALDATALAQRLAEAAVLAALQSWQPLQTLPPLHALQVVAQDQERLQGEEGGWQICRIPVGVVVGAGACQVHGWGGAEAAIGVLVVVDPVDVVLALLLRGGVAQLAQQVEGGDDEKGQRHAVAVVGRVQVRQEGLETALPVGQLARGAQLGGGGSRHGGRAEVVMGVEWVARVGRAVPLGLGDDRRRRQESDGEVTRSRIFGNGRYADDRRAPELRLSRRFAAGQGEGRGRQESRARCGRRYCGRALAGALVTAERARSP